MQVAGINVDVTLSIENGECYTGNGFDAMKSGMEAAWAAAIMIAVHFLPSSWFTKNGGFVKMVMKVNHFIF